MKFVRGEILTATKLQQLSDERSGNPTAGFHRSQGVVGPANQLEKTVRLVSGSGPTYSWVETKFDGTQWIDLPATGSATEVNGTTGLAAKRVRAYPYGSNWFFQYLHIPKPQDPDEISTPCCPNPIKKSLQFSYLSWSGTLYGDDGFEWAYSTPPVPPTGHYRRFKMVCTANQGLIFVDTSVGPGSGPPLTLFLVSGGCEGQSWVFQHPDFPEIEALVYQ